jgi:hypothetical protein
MNRRLPDFVIIGAIRSGTTSVARYLGAHPEIYMARQKEVRYFNSGFDKGVEWYASNFEGALPPQICGEATPAYMSNAEAMRRMSELIPDARLIALVREPAKRAWSHYWMRRERDSEQRGFVQAIEQEMDVIARDGPDGAGLHYLNNGMYAHHLKRVLDLYPPDNLLVVVFEQMLAEPEAQYQATCRFLGVDDEVIPENLGRPINSFVSFRSLRLRDISKRAPRQVRRTIGRLNTRRNASYPKMDDAARELVTEFFHAPNAELERLLHPAKIDWAT